MKNGKVGKKQEAKQENKMHFASIVQKEVWINNLKYDLIIRITKK